jgi:hypothetical protein
MRRKHVMMLLAAAAVLVPASAQAKMPPFAVELEPSRPAVGEPLTVTVRTKTSLRGFPDRMADLVALERAGESVAVTLRRSGDVYPATVTQPEPGRWTIRLFPRAHPRPGPDELARRGYRAPPEVDVAEVRRASRFSTAMLAVALAIAAAARAAGP